MNCSYNCNNDAPDHARSIKTILFCFWGGNKSLEQKLAMAIAEFYSKLVLDFFLNDYY